MTEVVCWECGHSKFTIDIENMSATAECLNCGTQELVPALKRVVPE